MTASSNAIEGFKRDLSKQEMEEGSLSVITPRALKTSMPPLSVEELLKKNPVELAHKILSQKIEIEEQKEGLRILKTSLKEMKEKNQSMNHYHQDILRKVNSDAEVMVERHQKLIKQLLHEKQELNKIMSQVADHFKLEEEKFGKTLKTLEDRHRFEIKRVKETQMVAEKIKREKWMETKIRKIKEMTVKGLEPELSRLAASQQKEMSDLRNLHKIELEAVELKAARRTTELMNQLREELERDKQNAIAKEMDILQNRLHKDFERERQELQDVQERLKGRIKAEEEKLIRKETEFRQSFSDFKDKMEEDKKKMFQSFHDKLTETKKQYIAEMNNLKESLQTEKDVWMNEYKRQEAEKFMEKERDLHRKYKADRDRDIDAIIGAFEKESSEMKAEMQKVSENKILRLKEQLENEMRDAEANEALLKAKLAEAKSDMAAKEGEIGQLNSQVGLLQAELLFFKQCSEKLAAEKTTLKDTIKESYEKTISELTREKQSLETELIALKKEILKGSMKKEQTDEAGKKIQAEMSCLISRLHAALTKKESTIQLLRQKHENTETRCKQLEFLLDNQRGVLLK